MTNHDSKPSIPVHHDWELAETFIDRSAGLSIRVSKRPMTPRFEGAIPVLHYSMNISYFNTLGDRHLPYRPMMCVANAGVVEIDAFPVQALSDLIHDASVWILTQAQIRQDEIAQQQRLIREEREAEQSKGPPGRPGLKTLAKMDAEKRKRSDK